MKLSEAIMMNGMTKPQGFGGDSMDSIDAPCALGGALQMVGRKQDYTQVEMTWPWTKGVSVCPECYANHPRVYWTVYHLNDRHYWTRAQIAEWVASIEPADDLEPQAPVVETTQEVTK